jgi:DNA replication protein DnaC
MATATLSDPLSPELRTLKLGKLLDTLPERLILARHQHLSHTEFLKLVLADEIARRESTSAALCACAAGLDPTMRLESWDTTAAIRYDQHLWADLTSLRFLDGPHVVLLLDPVGVGKPHLATALGHIAIRRHSVHMARADKLFKRPKAARLDNSIEAEIRLLTQTELLILDDFALQPLDPTQTTDFYELTVERHGKTATVITSNREPSEWLALMADQLLAQSAVDRLVSTAHELIDDGTLCLEIGGDVIGRLAFFDDLDFLIQDPLSDRGWHVGRFLCDPVTQQVELLQIGGRLATQRLPGALEARSPAEPLSRV